MRLVLNFLHFMRRKRKLLTLSRVWLGKRSGLTTSMVLPNSRRSSRRQGPVLQARLRVVSVDRETLNIAKALSD